LAAGAERLDRPTLYSGLLLEYSFLGAVERGELRYATWLVQPPVREAVASGRVQYLPARASDVPRVVRRLRPHVALARVTPPDENGYCSFGPSASHARATVQSAGVALAEVDPTLPRTLGDTEVHVSSFDALVEALEPACEYVSRGPSEVSRRIAGHVLPLLPLRPAVQLGIGEVPEALFAVLATAGLRPLKVVGMATDGVVDMFASGALDAGAWVPSPAVLSVELMGTRRLMEACDGNRGVGLYPADDRLAPSALAGVERLVSVNSALEVDLSGQVAAESVGDRVVAGLGGSVDFAEAAYGSTGGCQVVALPATAAGGRSRIVPRLTPGTPVSTPRHLVDHVVTEHGVAQLSGRTLGERADALIAVADPDHRPALQAATSEWLRRDDR
jgi:4-hydroxybutyrate CoA-transferase